ncbi:MAG TPA: dihydropteroate synthase [Flavobacteriales bacterium]|nr:dihydropteroate synthase [Flavobacteriales bacterium]|tara:strand:- start:3446 stop:4306 length:861 start_codon:yes stop_codon:yes gene_type:complete
MTKNKNLNTLITLECNSKLLDLSTSVIMGILNLTDDSFYDGGQHNSIKKALLQTEKMLDDGAKIIDIGAYSSRPKAKHISHDEEWQRLEKTLQIINKEFPQAILSVDTFRSEIARRSIDNGADIINDISAGNLDPQMFDTVADLNVPYIMMHMQGNPQTMQDNPHYNCIEKEVVNYFLNKVKTLQQKGLSKIIIDPGFGFGKTLEHNYQLLNNLEKLHTLEIPLLVGVSRKSMVYKVLETDAKNSLNGTTAIHTLCLSKGASILRVHDVKEAVECVKLINFAKNQL